MDAMQIIQENVTNTDMIMDTSPSNLRIETKILSSYVDITNLKILRRMYYTNVKKFTYTQTLSKVCQYSNVFNAYIFNYFDRYPSEITIFWLSLFTELDYYSNYINEELLLFFVNKYPLMVANAVNCDGQNSLMMFCSSLFCNLRTSVHNYDKVLLALLPLSNIFHKDVNNNTILQIICKNITSDYFDLVNNLLKLLFVKQFDWTEIVNQKNNFGYTALNYTSLASNYVVIYLLIRYFSAEPNAYDELLMSKNLGLKNIIDAAVIERLNFSMNNYHI